MTQVNSDLAALAKKLVSIESITGNENKIAEYIFDYLNSLDLEVEFQETGDGRKNVLVVGGGTLLFTSHLDTVPLGDEKWAYDPFGEIVGDRLYGRGACDTKANVASLLYALAENPSKNISCCFTVGEEDAFTGIKTLMELRNTRLKKAKFCVDLEPTELKIITTHKGSLKLLVSEKGKTAHGSTPEKGVNAISQMAKTITKIEEYSKGLRIDHETLGKPTINIGTINGGKKFNMVPDYAQIEVDRRVLPNEDVEEIVHNLSAAVTPADVRTLRVLYPVELDTNSKIIKTMQGILKKNHLDSKTYSAAYTTQFSELSRRDFQGFVFGCGSASQAHQTNEFVLLNDMDTCSKVLSQLFSEAAGW